MTEGIPKEKLTKREKKILREIKKEGYYPKVIAPKLGITHYTFNTHVRNMHRKTNTHNPAELMKFTYDNPSSLEDED